MDTPLKESLFQEISASGEGSISFADYMRRCLYDPDHGYYASAFRRTIGRGGDFYTSVSVGAGFGFFLGLAMENRWQESLGRPESILVVEQGAHDGQLALDILAGVRERDSEMTEAVRYVIFEPDGSRAAELRTRLAAEPDGESIKVVSDLPENPAPVGLFFCNELLDAFPVHRLRWETNRWNELRVGVEDSEGNPTFQWRTADLVAGSDLEDAASRIQTARLPDGYTTEVCLEILPWIAEASQWFQQGNWWVIDYGREAGDFHAPERHEGTLRGYRDHQRADDPFESPGEIDLTADVNFTDLDRAAIANGMTRKEFTDQHHFLIREATPWLQAIENGGPDALTANQKRLRQFQTLTHPGLMGRAFKVAEYHRD